MSADTFDKIIGWVSLVIAVFALFSLLKGYIS